MEQILTKNNNKVDAVVAENDGMAGGVVAALAAQGLAGVVPVSGQDGDQAGDQPDRARHPDRVDLEGRRDLGQTAAEAAVALASGKKMTEIPGVKPFTGGRQAHEGQRDPLTPLAVTKDNLNVIVDKGWITKAEVCAGVDPAKTPYCK